MYIPSLNIFQIIGTVLVAIAICTYLRSLNEAEAWNRCGQTLSVNHCPHQTPENTAKCREARKHMDDYELNMLRIIKRNVTEQKHTLYIMSATVGSSVLCYMTYYILPLHGQLCLGKVFNIAATGVLTFSAYSIVVLILYHNTFTASYGQQLCQLQSTVPLVDFGSPILKKCFQEYFVCENAILSMFTTGLTILATIFHFLAFFSACWDCLTQVDNSDWGILEDLPEYLREQQPEPPPYLLEEVTQNRNKKSKKEQRKIVPQKQELNNEQV